MRPLTDDEKNELNKLNNAVTEAIATRRSWLDTKMLACSHLQVADDIYDVKSGDKLGKVSALYRYWRDRDDGVRDRSLSCEYEYETSPLCYDNTSRQTERTFGTRQDAADYAQTRAERLRK
jgi:hypothetical protein